MHNQNKDSRNSVLTGVFLTVVVNAGLAVVLATSGFTYLDPPPPEKEEILIEFEEIKAEEPKLKKAAAKPRAEVPSKKINLVQQSQAQNLGTKTNQAEEATVGDKGDVEVPEPPRKEINKRALFSAANNKANKDTLAAQTAREVTDALKAGHALGNTKSGETSGEPEALVAGRTPIEGLPKPSYSVQASGTVVVQIWVNQDGKVERAVAGVKGTTVTNKTLWKAAYDAAMKARFNKSMEAKPIQEGTITYIFKLK